MATSSQDSQGETLALETQTFSQVKYYFWVRKVYKFMLHNPFGSISGRRSNYRMSPKVPNRIRCARFHKIAALNRSAERGKMLIFPAIVRNQEQQILFGTIFWNSL